VDSEVWVTYDDEHLYLAFVARDDDPAGIRYSLTDRDEIFRDDYFGIILDTYGNAAWAYEFFVNPLGIQGDLRWTPNGEDGNFDLVWHSRGRITGTGYQVEVAIPFSSLRFPDRPLQRWRATFWRDHPRDSRRRYSWAVMDRDNPCWPCNFGTLTGIRDVSPGSNLDLLPSVLGQQSSELRDFDDPESGLDHDRVDGQFSLNARYALSNSMSAEGTLNPDFSQVESDAAQVDVNTTFALVFPEQRPFFLDGRDLFETWIPAVYTRSINNPAGAVKLIGRMNTSSVAYLGGYDETSPVVLPFEERSRFVAGEGSFSNILRFKQTFLEDSHIGVMGTDRRREGGGSGSTAGLDGVLRRGNYRFEWQMVASYTEEPDDTLATSGFNNVTFDDGAHTVGFDGESYPGHAVYASLERGARHWNFDFDYWEYSPTFRADNGIVTANDSREATFWTGYEFQTDTRLLDLVFPNVQVRRKWNFRDQVKRESLIPELIFRLKSQTELGFTWTTGAERFREVDFEGIQSASGWVDTRFSRILQGGFWIDAGDRIARNEDPAPVPGDGFDAEIWSTIRPTSRLVISPSYLFSEVDDPQGGKFFSGYILRTRTNYQFTRRFFLRLVVQYNAFNDAVDVEPLLTYKVNPFTVFYLGSTNRYRELANPRTRAEDYTQTSRQLFAKLQYLFQR
jgi:hypothetical protein